MGITAAYKVQIFTSTLSYTPVHVIRNTLLHACMDRLFRLLPRVRNRVVFAKPDLGLPAVHDVLHKGFPRMLSLELPNPSRIPQLACDS